MAFRKRNVAVGRGTPTTEGVDDSKQAQRSGVRPSSSASFPVISTGTPSLDTLLGGHGGLPLGSSLLVEESGTTEYGGALLKYYAAEGICHGHSVHVVGVGNTWIYELPGLVERKGESSQSASSREDERMKIAWRYESVANTGGRALSDHRNPTVSATNTIDVSFCHRFDLSKRLVLPRTSNVNHVGPSTGAFPLDAICESVEKSLKSSSETTVHRLIIASILSPPIFCAPEISRPASFLRFLHALRALLRRYPARLTAMITLPLELFPRSSGLVRWAEILADGVLELTPFPHLMGASNSMVESGGTSSGEDQPQGIAKVHKVPCNTERGEGGAGAGNTIGEDLAFTVSRRKFAIRPYCLPPLEGDQDAQKEAGSLTSKDVEF